jgi:hypothetical protein
MKDIEAYSLRIRSKHLLMLFDSCFSGSLFSMVRAVPEDISEKSSQPVRQYITAGAEEEQVPDKSMFKRSLVVGLEGDADLTRDGYITGSELGLYLADKVVKYTKGKQHPQYGKINNPELDRGDFVFVPRVVGREELTSPPEDEKQKLAYIPKTVKSERVSLRKEAKKMLSDSYIKNMIRNYNFYERDMNPFGSLANDLVDNGDGTVTDKTTGLMWQKSGSAAVQKGNLVKNYLRQLNRDRFAGHSNWRLPTIDELASLLEKKNIEGFYIDPIFDKRQEQCWTADTEEVAYSKSFFETWAVNFKEGRIKVIIWATKKAHYRLYTDYDVSLYTRAVRSLEN